MMVEFNRLLPAMPELGMGLPNDYLEGVTRRLRLAAPRRWLGRIQEVAANSGRKLRVIGNQPGRGVKPPTRHHLREHRCHGRLRRPMLCHRDAPYPRPSLDLGPRLFLHGW